MELKLDLFDKAIAEVTQKPPVYSLHDANAAWLREAGVQDDLVEFLDQYAYASFVKIGHVTFNNPNEVKTENTDEQNNLLIKNGLLIIGNGLNGDPIVININNGQVGYVSHDLLWETKDCSLSEIYTVVSESVGSFFFGAATDSEFPVDYYQAVEVKNA